MQPPEDSIRTILDGAQYYSDARGMIGLAKFGSYVVMVIGFLICAAGLAAVAGEAVDVPGLRGLGPLPLLPGLVLVWVAINGLASAQTRQANLDAAEAALLSLKLMKETRGRP